jgi:hypothetical protein
MTWDPVTDKRIATLHPDIRAACEDSINQVYEDTGIMLRVTQGLRSRSEQADLFAQGRTKPGPIITQLEVSYHCFGLAFDVVEIKDGKAIWETDWPNVVPIIVKHGFEWGGNWHKFIDKPHFQRTYGKTVAELENLCNDESPYPVI